VPNLSTFPPFHSSTISLFHSQRNGRDARCPSRTPHAERVAGVGFWESAAVRADRREGGGHTFARMSGMLDLSRDEKVADWV